MDVTEVFAINVKGYLDIMNLPYKNIPLLETLNSKGFFKLHPAHMPITWIQDSFQHDKEGMVHIDNFRMIVKITSLGIKMLRLYKINIMADYLHKIHDFFKHNQGKKFSVSALTDNREKFLEHVKYYVDSRHIINEYLGDYVDISFNSDYSKITIHKTIQSNENEK